MGDIYIRTVYRVLSIANYKAVILPNAARDSPVVAGTFPQSIFHRLLHALKGNSRKEAR